MNQQLSFFALGLIFICVCAPAADKSLHLLVTPKGAAKFHCKVDNARVPEIEELGQTAFRVSVFGGSAPYTWRLPLYRENNGTNDIRASQIGNGRPDANHGFFITVPTAELGRVDMHRAPRLSVRSHGGASASCPIPLSPTVAKSDPLFLLPARAATGP